MKELNLVLNWVLPFAYLVTVIIYTNAFFSKKQAARKLKSPFLIATLVLHLIYLVSRTIFLDHPPIITVFDMPAGFCDCRFLPVYRNDDRPEEYRSAHSYPVLCISDHFQSFY